MADPARYLEFVEISKEFPGVRALDGVQLSVGEGSVRALIGENGAGKSTLLKILSGAYTPTEGKLRIDGKDAAFANTQEALDAGIAVIYQELHLAPEMTVAENLFLGHMPAKFGVVNKPAMNAKARRMLERLGEEIEPAAKVGRLPIAQRQMVEIAKALTRGAKIIAFDEPTSSLSDREIRRLFQIIRDLKDQGHVILYVSHRLEEIFKICDSVTVFRDGRLVETFETMDGVTPDVLVNRMVGRDIQNIYGYYERPQGEPALEANGLMGAGLKQPVSFSVSKGEILGVFGLVGAGRTELMKLIYGAAPKSAGTLKLLGRDITIRSTRDAIRNGMMLCPEDRKAEGVIPIRSVMENLNISARRRNGFVVRPGWEKRNATEQCERLKVRTPSLQQLIMNLSGGNQQKVILARWLSEEIKVLLMDEPTRGIDVGAKSEIYNIMYHLAEQGIGIVMVSSDLPEVMGASDRMMVMRDGQVSGFLHRAEYNEEKILSMALPASEPEATLMS
ncbi:L-arabinose ABC transporter ATP-binding protein AraG [Candidatus Sumerlaeota bacterium]|nr:L-arabinose ABC transporter ATP-binding protein AraG [Candidatus Sumerlaeota bacterium]